ncbi:MAG TPA: hypothetical protein VMT52_08110 [Planctomycetota bacterium]|nr:hypothetical protein [Planctomycetota bacterium]
MKVARLSALGVLGVIDVLAAGPVSPDEVLESPRNLAVCQLEYGEVGTLFLSWANAESYEVVEFQLDGLDAPGEVDGTFGGARLEAAPGSRVVGARGLAGDRVSPWTTAEFMVLVESPLREPVLNLDCEFLPGRGGVLLLTWTAGRGAWVSGRLSIPGNTGFVPIAAGAVSAEIPVGMESFRIAQVTFKNAEGYFSEPLTPPCIQRIPDLRRGDCDSNGRVNITDAVFQLNHLFQGGQRWVCDDGCDTNDDGRIDLTDPVATLTYLFQGGSAPPPPGPDECGMDLTADFLGGFCACE